MLLGLEYVQVLERVQSKEPVPGSEQVLELECAPAPVRGSEQVVRFQQLFADPKDLTY